MAKAAVQIHSFIGGKLDRLLGGRRDIKAYYSGALDMVNVVPLQLGGFSTRPGLTRITELPAAASGCRLAKFEKSTEATYLLAFVDSEVRIFHDGAQVATVATPWTAAMLAALDWTQSEDTMILVHPDTEYRKLVRQGDHATWALSILTIASIPTHDFGSGAEPVWSATRGWPCSVALHQGRLFFGGSKSLSTWSWGSRSGNFFDFGETAPPTGPLDDDAVSAALDSDAVNGIRQVFGTDDLFYFSSGGPWVVSSSEQPISPDSYLPRQYARVPAASVRPQVVNGNVVYVTSSEDGAHASVFELAWDEGRQAYYAQDLALRCPSLMRGPIDMAVRDTGDADAAPTVLVVNASDGTVAVLTPNRFENVTAWSELVTAGAVLKVCVVGNTAHFLVRRRIEGADRYFIERLDPAAHTDCAVFLTAETAQSVWTGLDHLEGRLVDIIADGHVVQAQMVSDGQITLTEAASTVEIGLPWIWKVTPMPIEAQLTDGTVIGHRFRPLSVAVQVVDTAALFVNGKLQEFRRFGSARFDEALPLFTGVHTLRLLGWHKGGTAPVTLSGEGRHKAIVLAITIEVAGG